MEKLLPLEALPEDHWVYKERPKRRLRSFNRDSLVQILAFATMGIFVGIATGLLWVYSVSAVVFRIAPLLRKPQRLPALLKSGRTRLIGTSAFAVQDSELVSDVFAASWLHWRTTPPTDNVLRIFFRRLQRRSYLLAIAVIVITAAIALAGALGQVAIVAFLIAWSILGAGLYRCSDFSRIGFKSQLPIWVLVAHSLLALTILWILWGIGTPLLTIPLVIIAVVWTGYTRGKPRFNDDLTVLDSGFGINVSPSLINYYLKGLSLNPGFTDVPSVSD